MKQDPLALAFFAGAIAVLVSLLLYAAFFFKTPEAPPGKRPAPAQVAAPESPAAQSAPAPRAALSAPSMPAAGHTWRYSVVVDPPVWRDATLTYKTRPGNSGMAVLTEFVHAGGRSDFNLGIYAPGHPSHENTRFPGFFMYAAYLQHPLNIGDDVVFSWHWQGKSPGSVKRFEGQVKAWDEIQVPAGKLRAAMIEGMLSYLEDGQFRERAYHVFWYAPAVSQIVRIHREGITSDESSRRIVAELLEYRPRP